MGQAAPSAGLSILRRILAYARKVLRWEDRLDAVRDIRHRPQIATSVIIRAVVVMFLGRLGSLNALEQTKPSRFWLRWLGRAMPSADSIGRICSLMDLADVRGVLHTVYTRLKRMKALMPPGHGLMSAVVDGHETTASRKRCCRGCCQRVLHTTQGDVLEYYHRYVALRLVGQDLSLMLDAEPIHPGEDELAAARRLVERALSMFPRAFDVVAGDALYANTDWFNFLIERNKHALAVLKDNRPNLIEDARSLFGVLPASVDVDCGKRHRRCWDCETFTSWPAVSAHTRVVRSLETRTVRRQLDGQEEVLTSDWMWVTTLSASQASTQAVVDMGHDRWSIENQGFNELVNRWHANHVFRHHPAAILIFALIAMLCLNVFVAFFCRNLKPEVRPTVTMQHVGKLIAAELYSEIRGPPRGPT